MGCMKQYAAATGACPRILIIVWFVAAGIFAKPAARLLDVTANIYATVPGSPSQIAHSKYKELFGTENQEHDVLLVKSDENLVFTGVLEQVSDDITTFFQARGLKIAVQGFATKGSSLADKLISKDRHSSIFVMSRIGPPIDAKVGRAELDLLAKLRDKYVEGNVKGSKKPCLSRETGGTCMFGDCHVSRNSTCIDGSCQCGIGECARNGQCVPQGTNKPPRLTYVG